MALSVIFLKTVKMQNHASHLIKIFPRFPGLFFHRNESVAVKPRTTLRQDLPPEHFFPIRPLKARLNQDRLFTAILIKTF